MLSCVPSGVVEYHTTLFTSPSELRISYKILNGENSYYQQFTYYTRMRNNIIIEHLFKYSHNISNYV